MPPARVLPPGASAPPRRECFPLDAGAAHADASGRRAPCATSIMTGLRSLIRRFGSAIGLGSALLLVCTAWMVGVHHHDPATAHECALCTTAHTPATIAVA